MTKDMLCFAAIGLGLLCGRSVAVCAAPRSRPNIVFILADDLGLGDTRSYGGTRCQIDTPHIDALAREGLRFTDAHANASVCVPTRVAIMTGRYPWRFGAPQPGGAWGFLGTRFDPHTWTLGKMFQTAGYRTGYVGKWHLGTLMATRDGGVQREANVDFTQPLRIGPPQYGFAASFILPGSLDMYPYAFVRNNVWQGDITARKGWSAFNRVGPAAEDFDDHRVLETFYGQAEAFLAHQRPDQPFFLYLALTAPHTPTSPGEAFRNKSRLGVYGDFVMEVDHGVKRVLDALQRHQLAENTLVLFSSDHGAAPYAGNILKATAGQIRDLEKRGHYSSGLHRGYKFSVYEGGLRVPLIARWPGAIAAGGICQRLIGLNDLMATFAELAGVALSPQQGPDSISFAPLLREPGTAATRQTLIMQSIGPFVVREGRWKLCLCPGSGSHGRLGNVPKSAVAWRHALEQFGGKPTRQELQRAPFVQLFDLSDDPHEDHNLAARQPQRVDRLVALLRQRIDRGRSTPGPELNNGRSPIRVMQRLPEFVQRLLR